MEASVEGWRGDIALDELQFTPGLCPNKANVSAVSPANRPVILPTPPPPYRKCSSKTYERRQHFSLPPASC